MTPEDRTPEMEELNNRRVERQLKRQETYAQKRRKKALTLAIAAAVVVLGMVALFFVLRAEEQEPVVQPDVTASTEKFPDNATVIQLVAAGDVNVTDSIVAAGGPEYDYTDTFLDVSHLLAAGDITVLNFEGNLCGVPYGSTSRSAPQSLMDALNRAGVDIVQLANS